MPEVRTRTAPSPTGDPHIGTFYNALFNYAMAKKNNGKFILRVEDTDRTRFAPGAEEKLYETFDWLGFKPDEGPIYGGNFGPYRQSERLELYKKYAQELIKKGAALASNASASYALANSARACYAYYCFCSQERLENLKKEQQTQGIIPPKYDRLCLRLSEAEVKEKLDHGESYVVRLKIPDSGTTSFQDVIRGTISFENELLDDQVLLKSDGFPTYHLAVVVDDHLMKITHVIRAEEWISATPKQILIYKALGWELPQFAHTSILRNPDHSKMSKRKNPTSILWYKEQGILPEALLNYLALMGWSHPQGKEIFSLEEFVEQFDLGRMSAVGPVFDIKKLEWLNGEWIRRYQKSKIKDQIYDFYDAQYSPDFIEKTLPIVLQRMNRLTDFKELVDFIFENELPVPPEEVRKLLSKYDADKTQSILQSFLGNLSDLSNRNWETEEIHKLLDSQLEKLQTTPKEAYMILRIALSGKTVGLPLFESMGIMEKDKVLKRLSERLI